MYLFRCVHMLRDYIWFSNCFVCASCIHWKRKYIFLNNSFRSCVKVSPKKHELGNVTEVSMRVGQMIPSSSAPSDEMKRPWGVVQHCGDGWWHINWTYCFDQKMSTRWNFIKLQHSKTLSPIGKVDILKVSKSAFQPLRSFSYLCKKAVKSRH